MTAELRAWLEGEYAKAHAAARAAAACRRPGERNPADLHHASATARMCAIGETLQRLDAEAPPDSGWTADTGPRRPGVAVADLLFALAEIGGRYPAARLVRNQVGNLAVVVDGTPAGWLDLTSGEYDRGANPPPSRPLPDIT